MVLTAGSGTVSNAGPTVWARLEVLIRLVVERTGPALQSKTLRVLAAFVAICLSMMWTGALWVGSRQGVRTVNKKRENSFASARRRSSIRRSLSEKRKADARISNPHIPPPSAWLLVPPPPSVLELQRKMPGLWERFLNMVPGIGFFSFLSDPVIVDVLTRLEPIEFNPGDNVFGGSASPVDGSLYILVTGSVAVGARVTSTSSNGKSPSETNSARASSSSLDVPSSSGGIGMAAERRDVTNNDAGSAGWISYTCKPGDALTPTSVLLSAYVDGQLGTDTCMNIPRTSLLATVCEASIVFKLGVDSVGALTHAHPTITEQNVAFLISRLHRAVTLTAVKVFGLGREIISSEASIPAHVREVLRNSPPTTPPAATVSSSTSASAASTDTSSKEGTATLTKDASSSVVPKSPPSTPPRVSERPVELNTPRQGTAEWETTARADAAKLLAAHLHLSADDVSSPVMEEFLGSAPVSQRPGGSRVVRAWDASQVIFVVLSGQVDLSIDGFPLFTAERGHLIGKLQLVAGEAANSVDAYCRTPCVLVACSGAWLARLCEYKPSVKTAVLESVMAHMSPLAMMLDFSLSQITVPAGTTLFRQGERAESLYVVLAGRVRATRNTSSDVRSVIGSGQRRRSWGVDGGMVGAGKGPGHATAEPDGGGEDEIVCDIGKGQAIGDFELFTNRCYDTTASAVRSTVLVCLSRHTLDQINLAFPHCLAHYCKNSATSHVHRLAGFRPTLSPTPAVTSIPSSMFDGGLPPSPSPLRRGSGGRFDGGASSRIGTGRGRGQRRQLDVSTVAVLPASSKVPICAFSTKLRKSLNAIARTGLVDAQSAHAALGDGCFEKNLRKETQLAGWLGLQEQDNDLVIYQGEANSASSWTRTCIGQADCVVLVVTENDTHVDDRVERLLEHAWERIGVRVHLVVLHSTASPFRVHTDADGGGGYVSDPGGNDASRSHSASIDTLLGDLRKSSKRFSLGKWLKGMRQRRRGKKTDEEHSGEGKRDWLHGTTHIYAGRRGTADWLRDEELNDIDMRRLSRKLAGVCVGLVLGGGGARGMAHLGVIRALEEAGVAVDMIGGTSIGAFVGGLYALYGHDPETMDARVVDFCAEMSSVRNKLLDLTLPITSWFSGYGFNRGIIKAFGNKTLIDDLPLDYFCISTDIKNCCMGVHSSGPLWRYVRASMSLQGYLPPICDDNGSLLLDGGYMNNLPTDVMRRRGAYTVIAVDVSAGPVTAYTNYGSHLSGWQVVANRLNPFSAKWQVPSMAEVGEALSYLSYYEKHRRTLAEADLYLQPPVQEYGTLQFDAFEEIEKKGYDYAVQRIEEWLGEPGVVANVTW